MRKYDIYLMNAKNERVYERMEVRGKADDVRAKLAKELPEAQYADHALIEWIDTDGEIAHAEGRMRNGKIDVQVQYW